MQLIHSPHASTCHVQKVRHILVTGYVALTHTAFRFQPSTDISGQTSVKSSVQRNIRSNILAQWNINPETLEEIWPKKEPITLVKWSVIIRGLVRLRPLDILTFSCR